MPFDGTDFHDGYSCVVVDDNPGRVGESWLHTHLNWPQILFISVWIIMIFLVSESIWPDSGLFTRLVYGNAIANRNAIARELLPPRKTWLRFTVAGEDYMVMPPALAKTPEEQQAVLDFAKWKNWPVYAADGPLVIDP